MSNKKVLLSVFIFFVANNGLGMDKPDPKKPHIYPALEPSIGSSDSSGILTAGFSTLPTDSQSWFAFNPVSAFVNAVCSGKETIENKMYFSSMLSKVAYPLSDSSSAENLKICQKTYESLDSFQDSETLKKELERCLRRTWYLTQIASKLSSCADAREIAEHVMMHQRKAMNGYLSRFFPAHLQAQREACNRSCENVEKSLKGEAGLVCASAPVNNSGQAVITVPTTFSTVTNYLFDCASSLCQTAKLKLSDEQVIQKIENEDITIYNKELPLDQSEELTNLLEFAYRRTDFMVRIFLYLPKLPPIRRMQIAAFCLQHHHPAMFPPLFKLFDLYMKQERAAAHSSVDKVLQNSGLNIVNEGNIMQYFGKIDEQPKMIQQTLGLANIVLLKQVHGVTGCVITEDNCGIQQGVVEGDFLVTNCKNIGLGVSTADCLPIIFVDQKHNAVGIAHAGWRGSIANIVNTVFDCMKQNYGTELADVAISFGPCIQKCCYEVGEDFLPQVNDKIFPFSKETIAQRSDGKYFFDLPLFNAKLLMSLGVPETAITAQQSKCTMCSSGYNSYRRDGDQAGRQISCIWVK